MQTMLQIKHRLRGGKAEFLEYRRNHHRAKPQRISCDEYERELPGESAASKSVIEPGMRDRRRVLLPNRVIQKVKRRDHKNSIDAGNPENNFGKFHAHLGGILCAPLCPLW